MSNNNKRISSRSQKATENRPPKLRFSPTAWAKLLYLRDYGTTEVGGFGITAAADPLYVQDMQLVRQLCTSISVVFDDDAVAQFFDQQVDSGRQPAEFARVWIHTHPGSCPQPSDTDEETFARAFGAAHWAVMFILACGGASYARLRFNIGPGGEMVVPVEIDYLQPFGASDVAAWKQEYVGNVCELQPAPSRRWRPQLDQELLQLDDELLASFSFNPEHWFYDC